MKHFYYKKKHTYYRQRRSSVDWLFRIKRILSLASCVILLPVICTIFLQGVEYGEADDFSNRIQQPQFSEDTTAIEMEFDESRLIGILAHQISMHTKPEAVKAQAVIARTSCMRALEQGEEEPVGWTEEQMHRLWGRENYSLYYNMLKQSIEATRGEVMIYEDAYIRPDFHAISAGYTRNAAEIYQKEEYPYLQKVDSRMDIVAQDFLKVEFYSPEEFMTTGEDLFRGIEKNLTASQILEQIQVTKTDSAGYVLEVKIGENSYSGEEMRHIFKWNSAAVSLKEVDGQIRVVTKGLGHGLGASLYGMQALAEDGYTYKDILEYYYQNISFKNIYD